MSGHSPNRKFVWILSAILVLFISGIFFGGWYYLKEQERNLTHKVHDELEAIADLKVGQIANWYRERQSDAVVLLNTPGFVAGALRLLTNPADGPARQNLLKWMEAVRNANDYAVVTLYDAQGAVRLSTEPDAERLDDHYAGYFQRALSIGTVVTADLYRSQPGRPIRLSILVPLRKKSDAGPPADGVILLQIDPDRFLYSLVQRWPMPSRTAETLLVRREGNEVVYLNELRHHKNTALTLRLPIDPASRLPAAMAAQGREGVFEGVDYRGMPALAAVRRVGGTPWWLVAKVDREEVYAPLRVQARLIAMFAGALVLAATLGVGLVWYRRDSAFSRQELSLDRQRRVLAERIVHLTKHANDIILLYDRDFRILEANDRALEAYGYSLPELRKLTVRDLRAPQTRADFDRQVSAIKSDSGAIIETVHQRKDGTQFAVEVSFHVAEIDGTIYRQSIIRDITGRTQAEKALREARSELEKRVQERTRDFAKTNEALQIEIVERKRAETKINRQSVLLDGVNQVLKAAFTCETEEELAKVCLGVAERLTGSKFGFIDELNSAGVATTIALTGMELGACTLPPSDAANLFEHIEARDIRAAILREGQSVMTDPDSHPGGTGLPKDHHPSTSFLGVLLQHGGRIIGLMGLGNKKSDYGPEDQEAVEALSTAFAGALMRRRTEHLMSTLHEDLALRSRELEAANNELEAFSYSVSHDLRAPLRAIAGFALILAEDHAEHLDEEGRRILGVITNETRRMGQLIDDLLAFSRMARRECDSSNLDMTELAQAVLEGAAAQATGRELHWTVNPLPPAQGDRDMLRQVWANLLSNAIKFTKPRKCAAIEIGSSSSATETVYFVRDNGVGFDMKYAHKLFGVFQRLHTEEEFEGTGVGLALVQRIIRRHGGRVWAEGEVNRGATFYFALPNKQETS